MTLEQGQVLFSIVKTWDNCFSLETIIKALTRKLQMQNNETIWGCPSVLICEEPTTRMGAFLKPCQMREKSSVSPNLIGEKSHDFAAGGFWLLARRLESTVIHSHYKPQTEQSQAMHGMGGAMHTHTRVATRVHFRKWSHIGGNANH